MKVVQMNDMRILDKGMVQESVLHRLEQVLKPRPGFTLQYRPFAYLSQQRPREPDPVDFRTLFHPLIDDHR
jgi:hypothetical protein